MQMLAAATLESTVRTKIAEDKKADRKRRGALRKGAFFISRGIYLKEKASITQYLDDAVSENSVDAARKMAKQMESMANRHFSTVVKIFDKSVSAYLKTNGGDADAALKNTRFAREFEEEIKAGESNAQAE